MNQNGCCIFGSEAAVKAKMDSFFFFFPRRKSHLISLGQFVHNSTTFEDQKPQELGKPSALGRSSNQLTRSEAVQAEPGSLHFGRIHLIAFLVKKQVKAEESFPPLIQKSKI